MAKFVFRVEFDVEEVEPDELLEAIELTLQVLDLPSGDRLYVDKVDVEPMPPTA